MRAMGRSTASVPDGGRPRRPVRSVWSAWLAASLLATTALPAHALFADDEARRAILELRARADAQRQALEAAERQLQELQSGGETSRRGVFELSNQIESLRREVAELRGQQEKLARDVAELQRQQRDALAAFDERLRALEPAKVTVDGVEFTARPDEKAAFEAAMAALRTSEFPRAAQLYGDFLARYPGSGYAPLALYWQGNALYAARQYRPAIDSYQRLLDTAPQHPRAPEALLAIASCQLELKDAKAARASWQALIKRYPDTEAAATARERLARTR